MLNLPSAVIRSRCLGDSKYFTGSFKCCLPSSSEVEGVVFSLRTSSLFALVALPPAGAQGPGIHAFLGLVFSTVTIFGLCGVSSLNRLKIRRLCIRACLICLMWILTSQDRYPQHDSGFTLKYRSRCSYSGKTLSAEGFALLPHFWEVSACDFQL